MEKENSAPIANIENSCQPPVAECADTFDDSVEFPLEPLDPPAAEASTDTKKFMCWMVGELGAGGVIDLASIDVLSQAASRPFHQVRVWLATEVFYGLEFAEGPGAETVKLIGRRLGQSLSELPDAVRAQRPPYRDLIVFCARLLNRDDPARWCLKLANLLAMQSVTADKPWVGVPEPMKRTVRGPGCPSDARASRPGLPQDDFEEQLAYVLGCISSTCRLEMSAEAPFSSLSDWPASIMKMAATGLSVRAGRARAFRGHDLVANEWRAIDRHVMRAMVRELGSRSDFVSQSEIVESLIWLDGQHGADDEGAFSGLAVDGPSMVVCKQGFARDNGDERDGDMLGACAPLCTPLPLPVAPGLEVIQSAKTELLGEFPWAQEVLDVVFDQVAASTLLGATTLYMEPTLIVGQPGAGKSRLVRRIAEVLHLEKVDIPLGGNDDTKVLSGTSRGWASGRPGDILVAMAERRTASVAVILDELDKAAEGRSTQGGVHSYLLALLEPETAVAYRDNYLKTPCDLSAVIWLSTANSLDTIPAALMSRLRVLHLAQPKPEHFRTIAAGVINDLAKRWRIDRRAMPTVAELVLPWESLGSAREVRRAVEAGVAQYALGTVRGASTH